MEKLRANSLWEYGGLMFLSLNVHAPCEDKRDDVKGSFYEELGHVFGQFPRYNRKSYWVISMRK
jgi:hypothetical protein